MTASNLLLVDMEGNVIRGNGNPEATAFWIHRCVPASLASHVGTLHHVMYRQYQDLAIVQYYHQVLEVVRGSELSEDA